MLDYKSNIKASFWPVLTSFDKKQKSHRAEIEKHKGSLIKGEWIGIRAN